MNAKIAAVALAACILISASTRAAPGAGGDCAKAVDKAERAICGDPEATAADQDMAAAYSALRAKLPESEKAALLSLQRHWLAARSHTCVGVNAPSDYAECLARFTQKRTAYLRGKPESGPGAGPMRPYFPVYTDDAKNKDDVEAELFLFENPSSPLMVAFNRHMRKIASEAEDALRESKEPKDYDFNYYYSASVNLDYVSPKLISASVSFGTYTGGAHGGGSTHVINIDGKNGNELSFDMAFSQKSIDELNKICFQQVFMQKKEKLDNFFTKKDELELREKLKNNINELNLWAFSTQGAAIAFSIYTLGTYAEGSYTCIIALSVLRSLAKPDFPLPE